MPDTYPADNVLVVGEVGFAVLAAVDLVTVQVRIVRQAHGRSIRLSSERLSDE